jgi:hypothetical protein
VLLFMRNSEACPGLLQELAFVPATRQAQETNRLPANQLGFGGNLETDSGGSGFLWRHPVAAAFGLLIFPFLRFGDNIIFFGSRGRRGGGLLSTIRGRVGRAGGGGAGVILVARYFGAEGDGARLAGSVTNRGHDANIVVIIGSLKDNENLSCFKKTEYIMNCNFIDYAAHMPSTTDVQKETLTQIFASIYVEINKSQVNRCQYDILLDLDCTTYFLFKATLWWLS